MAASSPSLNATRRRSGGSSERWPAATTGRRPANSGGIAPSSVRNWMKASEDGDSRYAAVAHRIRVAEACAEDETIADVRAAGKDPRFWTAGMTWAERKFLERWGRRQDDANTPRVVVQMGSRAATSSNVGARLPK